MVWDGTERRAATLTLKEVQDEIEKRITEKLELHAERERHDKDEILAEVKKLRDLFISAFPDDDPTGHRRYHEETIEFYKDMRSLAREVRNNTVKGVIWGVLLLVALAIWQYAKQAVKM